MGSGFPTEWAHPSWFNRAEFLPLGSADPVAPHMLRGPQFQSKHLNAVSSSQGQPDQPEPTERDGLGCPPVHARHAHLNLQPRQRRQSGQNCTFPPAEAQTLACAGRIDLSPPPKARDLACPSPVAPKPHLPAGEATCPGLVPPPLGRTLHDGWKLRGCAWRIPGLQQMHI